jgi:hypothetical protein
VCVAAVEGSFPWIVGIDEFTGAKIDIVLDDESCLEILLGVWRSNLALGGGNLCLLLCFEDLVELPTTLL